ncbi:hypothetical protein D3C72_1624380 [compost metagenome]
MYGSFRIGRKVIIELEGIIELQTSFGGNHCSIKVIQPAFGFLCGAPQTDHGLVSGITDPEIPEVIQAHSTRAVYHTIIRSGKVFVIAGIGGAGTGRDIHHLAVLVAVKTGF